MSTVASGSRYRAGVVMHQPPALHPGMALGAVALALFGALWLGGGASAAYPGSWRALAAVATGALALVAWALATFHAHRRAYPGPPNAATRARLRRGFILINTIQWSLIGVAIPVLDAVGHADWLTPLIIFVVGVHFVPLARLLEYRGYYWTTLGLVLVAGGDLFVGSGHSGLALGAAGVVLWGSAVRVLMAMRENAGRDAVTGATRAK